MRVLSTPRFERDIKKLRKQEKEVLDSNIRLLMKNSALGEIKKGDLAGIRVHKFPVNQQQALLAYAANPAEKVIILLGYGSHENFYRDLKKSKLPKK